MPELTNQTILVLSLPRHDEKYTSTTWQINAELARDNRVILVDHPFTLTEAFRGVLKKHIRKRLLAYFGRAVVEKEGIEVLLPPFVWPVNFLPKGRLYDYFSMLNHQMVANRINRYLKAQGIESFIYVNSFDFYFPDLPNYFDVKFSMNVYHCLDPMVKEFTLRHGKYLQQRAAQTADMVISTAPALQKSFVASGIEKSYLVPNAANFKLFSQGYYQKPARPESLNGLNGRLIGYLGNIERRIDFDLLHDTIEALPSDWRLILAGPVEPKYIPEKVFDHPRIHFTGLCNHSDAPAMVAAFDIAIIPFKVDEVSTGIYPLKLYEYLAAGKPVICTPFNMEVISPLLPLVSVASSAKEFAEATLRSYTSVTPRMQAERLQLASQNTWTHRAAEFAKLLNRELTSQKKQNVTQGKINW